MSARLKSAVSHLLRWWLIALLLGFGLIFIQRIPVSTPQVVKIGVIAPFEGLYRQTGYAALAEVRRAIEEQQAALGPDWRVMPVALDDAGDPQQAARAAQKLLVDPDVKVIIGPFLPQTIGAVETIQADLPLMPWLPLYKPGLDGDDGDLISEVATLAKQQNLTRLVIAGWMAKDARVESEQWRARATLPLYVSDNPQDVAPTDLIIWLGDPASAASYLNRLRTLQPAAPFWMGPTGGDPVFSDLAHSFEHVYWSIRVYEKLNALRNGVNIEQPTVYEARQLAQLGLNFVRTTNSPQIFLEGDDYIQLKFYHFQLNEDGSSSPANLSSWYN